eukprot:2367266-Pleurochrysis_carterae.AAC.1
MNLAYSDQVTKHVSCALNPRPGPALSNVCSLPGALVSSPGLLAGGGTPAMRLHAAFEARYAIAISAA